MSVLIGGLSWLGVEKLLLDQAILNILNMVNRIL
jgi:hypothetical protein